MKPTKTPTVPEPKDQVRLLIDEIHNEEIPERLLVLARKLQDALDERSGKNE